MSITLVQSVSVNATSASSISAAFPSPVTAGNGIIAILTVVADPISHYPSLVTEFTDTLSNPYRADASLGGANSTVCSAVAKSSGACTATAVISFGTGGPPFPLNFTLYEVATPGKVLAFGDAADSSPTTPPTNIFASGSVGSFVAGLDFFLLLWATDYQHSGSTFSVTAGYGIDHTVNNSNPSTFVVASRIVNAFAGGSFPSASFTGSNTITTHNSFGALGAWAAVDPAALGITCDSPPDGKRGYFYSHAFPATGGIFPYTFAISSGALPTGVALAASTGIASGTPTVPGTFSFDVQVTDGVGSTASVSCSITIADGGFPAWLMIDEPTIGWTDQSHKLHMADTIKFSWIAGHRGTASVPLVLDADSTYKPTIGSQVQLWDLTEADNFRVFSGTIDDYELKWTGQNGTRYFDLTCVSLEQVFDTIRLPSLLFENEFTGDIFTALFGYASGCPVSAGTIDSGVLIANFLVSGFPTISECFTRLATLSGYIWYVDPSTNQLSFTLPDTTPAPFTVESTDVLWEQFTFKEERHDYRNRQILKIPSDAQVLSSELFAGAGQTSFTMLRPVDQLTNGWTTNNTQNSATLTLSGQPSPGDTIRFQFPGGSSSFAWHAATVYASGQAIVDSNGYVQKCTAPGTTGGSEPSWIEAFGEITTDNTVTWTNQGPAGFSNGDIADYMFVTTLDNTQFGQVIIGGSVADTCQNISDAINAIQDLAGSTFSLPTWENPQVNADPGASTVVVRNKAAGAGFIVAVSKTGANLSWSNSVTTGGTTTFGTEAVTIGVQGQTTGGSGFTVVYTPGSNICTSATPLNVGTSLQLEYAASNAGFIQVENSADVAARAIIEDGTGKYQQSSSDDSSLTLPQFLTLAQQQLAAYGVIPQTFEFTTFRAGLYVGRVLDIAMVYPSGPGGMDEFVNTIPTSEQWFIQEINGESVPLYGEDGEPQPYLPDEGGHYKYTVKCINTTAIGDWVKFWQNLTGGGSSGGGSASSGGATASSSPGVTVAVASGVAALGTSAIASGAAASTVTVPAAGVLATDVLSWGFNSDPTGVTGYGPSAGGSLIIVAFPTAGNVNFIVMNNNLLSITPGAITLNWNVVR